MKYFTIAELEHSDTAVKNGIDNTSNGETRTNLIHLIEDLLDKVRERWGHPLRVNSGYRCSRLNKMVGGVPNSQHVLGEAADITAGNPDKNKMLYELIIEMMEKEGLLFDQSILEDNAKWIHISYKWKEIKKNRKQLLVAIRGKNGKMYYSNYLRNK